MASEFPWVTQLIRDGLGQTAKSFSGHSFQKKPVISGAELDLAVQRAVVSLPKSTSGINLKHCKYSLMSHTHTHKKVFRPHVPMLPQKQQSYKYSH